MFRQGQKIAYPMHGVGQIEEMDEAGYLTVSIPQAGLRIRIPAENAAAAGVRPLLGRAELERLLRAAGQSTASCSENWALRCKEQTERLKSGRAEDAAAVIRLLLLRAGEKKLSVPEGRLLSMARQVVLSEMISVYEINGEEAADLLAKWLEIR